MRKKELLKRIEELEQAVALLQQKVAGIENEMKMEPPPLIYKHLTDTAGLPCYEQVSITVTPTEETTICMPSKGTDRTANIYIADPNN